MMKSVKKIFKDFYFFFPVQLVLETFRRNHMLVLFWFLLFLFITKGAGYRYGVYTLFLGPEYLEHVNFLSFLILGFTTGIFIMTYHISSYITNAYQFPVIATLSRPFLRFSLNNFIIPIGFIITYLVFSIRYQHDYLLFSFSDSLINILSFLTGIVIFYILTFAYFRIMNRSMENLISLSKGKLGQWKLTRPLQRILQKDLLWKAANAPVHNIGNTRVGLYLYTPFHIGRAPMRITLQPARAQQILNRNRSFAVVFALLILFSLTLIGLYINKPFFAIPAAASLMLMSGMALLLYDLFYVFFKEYALWIFLALLVLLFYIINSGIIVHREGQAYGLIYNTATPDKELSLTPGPGLAQEDYRSTLAILDRWKEKVKKNGERLPRLVIINNCGGGLKAALWSYYSIAYADSLLDHRLLPHVELLTGASGGMFGAAYLRELYLRKQQGYRGADSLTARFQDLSRDMLNPMVLHLALKDWFVTFQTFEYNHQIYRRDRGWALEHKFNKNTGYILNKPLSGYRKPEEYALIPLMFLTPTTINDGRQLLISPIHTSYMCDKPVLKETPSMIEFLRAYQSSGADQLRFTSALRLNASYPFITPVATLPGKPPLNVTDAGLRDNFGYLASLRFLYVFRDWINQNTGGVVFISIGIDKKNKTISASPNDVLAPFENLYEDFFNIQQLNGQVMVHPVRSMFDVDFDILNLNLDERSTRISLSWHLTAREKELIKTSIYTPGNQTSLKKLQALFK